MTFILSEHAKFQLNRRNISEENVLEIANNPQQVIETSEDFWIYQSVKENHLIRVFINPKSQVIITIYRTSKIEKYWQPGNAT